jgi:hypothetical protein
MLLLLSMAMSQASPLPPETWKEGNHPDMPVLPACGLGKGAGMSVSIANLPKEASSELLRYFKSGGGIAEADGAYNSTDVVDGKIPRYRFIRAYHVKDYWIIWYERGGIVTGQMTLALEPDKVAKDGRHNYRTMPGTALSGNLCAATKALLIGVRSGGG